MPWMERKRDAQCPPAVSTTGNLGHHHRAAKRWQPNLEQLEERVVMDVTGLLPPTDPANYNFTTSQFSPIFDVDTNYVPHDSNGAVGGRLADEDTYGSGYLVSVNSREIVWQQKDGTGLVVQSLVAFWGTDGIDFLESQPYRPQVLFDQYPSNDIANNNLDDNNSLTGRFVTSALVNRGTSTSLLVAVSQTNDPNDGWYRIEVPLGSFRADFPSLGVTSGTVVIAVNLYDPLVPGLPNDRPTERTRFFDSRVITIPKVIRVNNQSPSPNPGPGQLLDPLAPIGGFYEQPANLTPFNLTGILNSNVNLDVEIIDLDGSDILGVGPDRDHGVQVAHNYDQDDEDDGVSNDRSAISVPSGGVAQVDTAYLISLNNDVGSQTVGDTTEWLEDDATLSNQLLVGDVPVSHFAKIWRIVNPGNQDFDGSPQFNTPREIQVTQQGLPIGDYFYPPPALALGSVSPIDTLDTRAMDAVWRNEALWAIHTVETNLAAQANLSNVIAHGFGAPIRTFPAQVWTPVNLSSVRISSEIIGPGVFAYNPSLTLDIENNVGISFNASSNALYIGAYYTGIERGDNISCTPVLLFHIDPAVAAAPYNLKDVRALNTVLEWGQYSGIHLDPDADENADEIEGFQFWAFNAYADLPVASDGVRVFGTGRWSTRWGKFRLLAAGQGGQTPPGVFPPDLPDEPPPFPLPPIPIVNPIDQRPVQPGPILISDIDGGGDLDGIVFIFDVSRSMQEVNDQDINFDGRVDNADDFNGDGNNGSLLDLALLEVTRAILNSTFMGLPTTQVAIIIFAGDALFLDMSADVGQQIFTPATADSDGDGELDILALLRTIGEGSGGLYSESRLNQIEPTVYDSPLNLVAGLEANDPNLLDQGYLASDGTGRLIQDPANLATLGVPINLLPVGPYFNTLSPSGSPTLGPLQRNFLNIATLTGGGIIPLNNPQPIQNTVVAGVRVVGPDSDSNGLDKSITTVTVAAAMTPEEVLLFSDPPFGGAPIETGATKLNEDKLEATALPKDSLAEDLIHSKRRGQGDMDSESPFEMI